MATWQFSIDLIPRSWAIENKFNLSLLYSKEGHDTEIAWKQHQPTSDFRNILSDMLPPAKSWSTDLLCWGNEKGHDIQVWYENEIIASIEIRLDLSQKLSEIIVTLVKTAKELDCVLFFPELKTITEANEFELKKALQKSRAAQFVKNPHGFLRESHSKT